jgi:hypothetical protein
LTLNGIESDIDCGGDCADKCDVEQKCGRNADCASGKCDGGKCQAPSCTDSVQNDVETDVDCGGSVCVAAKLTCTNGKRCQADGDCTSKVCNALTGLCQAQSCTDKRLNQNETDVDCGGACGGCETAKKCLVGDDCKDGICSALKTCDPPKCGDGVKNGLEGGKDCGVACGNFCPVGSTCNNNEDCAEKVCGPSGICMAPLCNDKAQNGSETDMDCGGTCSSKCAAGLKCSATADCAQTIPNTLCTNKICTPPGCTDNAKTGQETDVDCGGPQCKPCALGKLCIDHSDCEPITSGSCDIIGSAQICVAATCSDNLKNGAETDKDCGGSNACARCLDNKICKQGSDCANKVCDSNLCAAASCTDGQKNGAETALDCGGATCSALGKTCPDDTACLADTDCNSGWCHPTSKVCKERTCFDTLQNGAESDVDCGAICPTKKCELNLKCNVDADCASGTCSECTGKCISPPSRCYRQLSQDGDFCHQCAVGEACSTDFDCRSLNCNATTKKCEAADGCAGQLITDADGLFANGTKICNGGDDTQTLGCYAYLRCFSHNGCTPLMSCYTGLSGSCGQNSAGIGAAGRSTVEATWTASGCTSP